VASISSSYTPDTDGESIICGETGYGLSNSATTFNRFNSFETGFASNWNATEFVSLANGHANSPDWVFQDMRVKLLNAPGSGNQYVFTSRVNEADGNSTLTIAGALATFSGGLTSITATYLLSLAGNMPYSTGALLKKQFVALTGSMPALSGGFSRVVIYARTLTGTMPSSSGTFARAGTYARSLAGALPAFSGTLATARTYVQALSGALATFAGSIATSFTGGAPPVVANIRRKIFGERRHLDQKPLDDA
jgi:hypothetical protein